MLQTTFYFQTMRKLTVAFGSIFDNINIVRFDTDRNPIKTIKVPLAYGSKQKWIQRINQGTSLTSTKNKKINIGMTLPRLAFEITNIQYDPNRQRNSLTKTSVVHPDRRDSKLYQRNAVPYDVSFDLHLMVKNADDALQVVEQILPYFTPEYTVTIKEIPVMSEDVNVPIILGGMTKQDTYEGSFNDLRIITWTLSFVAKAYFYPPITDGKIIKTIYDNFYTDSSMQKPEDAAVVVGIDPKTANEDDYSVFVSLECKPVYDSNGNVIHFITPEGTILIPS